MLTGSGLAFADPRSSRRLELVRDGSFKAAPATLSSGSGTPWGYAGGAGPGITVNSDRGHSVPLGTSGRPRPAMSPAGRRS